jgi:hypothetical protein
MTQKYKSIITNAGIERLAAGLSSETEKVTFAEMAVGDGGGVLPVPVPEQTTLINEVWRAKINSITQHPQYANCIVIELVIPPEIGGFWARELGLYDTDGLLIAVSNIAESYKPSLDEGSGRASTVRMIIAVSNIASVDLHIDSSTVMATKEYVDDELEKHAKSRNHPDGTLKEKGFVQLSSATDSGSETLAATPKAVKAAVAAGDAANKNAEKRLLKTSNLGDVQNKVTALENLDGVPKARKINGHALSDDTNITSQDIFDGQAVYLGESADLNNYTTPGLYFQPANANAIAGKNYPEPNAGSLEIYKHAGVTQVYRIYNNSRTYVRACYLGVWSVWVMQYDGANPPTAQATGALPITGGNLTGDLKVGTAEKDATVDANFYKADGTHLPGTIQRYLPQCSDANNAPFGFSGVFGAVANFPTSPIYGTLLTMCTAGTRGFANIQPPTMDIWYQQIFFGTDSIQYVRTQTNTGGWSAWSRLASTDYVEKRVADLVATMNQRISDVQNWSSQNFVSSIQLGAVISAWWPGSGGDAPSGYVLTGGDYGDDQSYARYKPIQFWTRGGWVNAQG